MTEELSLDGVVRSFNESSEILDQLRQRLVGLASSDDVRQQSSNSLQNSADQLAEVAHELKAHTEHIVALGGQLGDAARLAEAQLSALAPDALLAALGEQRDGLRELAERVESMKSATNESTETLTAELTASRATLVERVESMKSATSASIETLAAELTASRATIEQQSAELATIRSKVAAIPEKVRRKHGLDGGSLPPPAT
jgi:chromosome segregation ATPase